MEARQETPKESSLMYFEEYIKSNWLSEWKQDILSFIDNDNLHEVSTSNCNPAQTFDILREIGKERKFYVSILDVKYDEDMISYVITFNTDRFTLTSFTWTHDLLLDKGN